MFAACQTTSFVSVVIRKACLTSESACKLKHNIAKCGQLNCKITEIDVISTSEKCLKIKSYYQKKCNLYERKIPFQLASAIMSSASTMEWNSVLMQCVPVLTNSSEGRRTWSCCACLFGTEQLSIWCVAVCRKLLPTELLLGEHHIASLLIL